MPAWVVPFGISPDGNQGVKGKVWRTNNLTIVAESSRNSDRTGSGSRMATTSLARHMPRPDVADRPDLR